MYQPYEDMWNGYLYDRQMQGWPSSSFPQTGGFPGFPIGGGQGSGGQSAPPAPPQHIISQYQQALSQPQSMQSLISAQSAGGHQAVHFAAGCNRRWTLVFLRNGQVFLMFVLSSQPFGRTTGFIWPNFTFGSFQSSSILAYSCA
ncbi:hypothetical protein [Bacillus safensis]|uniref:hypothetical protein n=1 Tax=Bacillus safensis TaxID=561879 RepID=UPI00115F13F0|nr:hypothetical protein [Bacillus sp. SDF0016]TQR26450.1 hypothetical protein C7Y46_04280 [Bacillus sp. SDF0016]